MVQFVIGKLAYSTSNGAALFLIGYGLLAFWCLKAERLAHPRWLGLFLLALGMGHALNLWITLAYLHEMGIPASAHVYHWRGDHYSFTSLFHSHLGKTAFAAPAQFVGWANTGTYDGGELFLPWVPVWASWSIGVAFVAGLLASLMALPALARQFPAPSHRLLFVLAAALALRGMIDGGPLAAGMPPAFAALGWLVLRSHGNMLFGVRYLAFVAFLLAGYLALWIGQSDELPALGGFVFPACLFVWLGLAGLKGRLFPRVALVAVLAFSLALDAAGNLLPMVLPQPPGCRAFKLTVPEPTEYVCAGESAFATYTRLDGNPRKAKALLLATQPSAGGDALSGRILFVDARDGHVTLSSSRIWQQITLAPMSLPGGWLAFSATVRAGLPPILSEGESDVIGHNNFNVYLRQLAGEFSQQGLAELLIWPVRSRQ